MKKANSAATSGPTTNFRHSALIGALVLIFPFFVAMAPSTVHANTITVNTIGDPGPSGTCDLRDAITNANNKDQSGSTNCVAGSGTDTIVFTVSGTITLGTDGTLPAIVNTLTIDSSNQTITIDGASTYQVLFVNVGSTLNLDDLTIAHGSSSDKGGGIQNAGTLTATNCMFSNNASVGSGGAIYNNGTLTVISSTFLDNQPGDGLAGGGIGNFGGKVTVMGSTFSGNSASSGGAIHNTARPGPIGGTLKVTNSTFSNNSAEQNGGGINTGGADTTATISNCTFSDNSAGVAGGGISGGIATVSNSIFADSTSGGNCSGGVTDGGYNLSDDNSCGFAGTGANGKPIGDNVNDVNVKLGALADNGGFTQTLALGTGSYAIDAIPKARCPSTDQRGAPRPDPDDSFLHPACDIGAFESGNEVWITPSSLNFGTVPVGQRSAPMTVMLNNQSGQDLKIRQWSIGANYTIVSTSCPSPPSILPSDDSCTFAIAFRPIYGGVRNELFQVNDNLGQQIVHLSATAKGK